MLLLFFYESLSLVGDFFRFIHTGFFFLIRGGGLLGRKCNILAFFGGGGLFFVGPSLQLAAPVLDEILLESLLPFCSTVPMLVRHLHR